MPIIQGPDAKYPKKVASIVQKHGTPEQVNLHSMAGSALASALQSGDGQAVYEAFHDLFQLCEMQPHGEYESEEDE